MQRNFISALAAIFVGAGAGMVTPHPYPVKAAAQSSWDSEAEQTFRLGRGGGRQLMTQEEWRDHQQKMKSMSQSEREKYRQEWHNKMTERAHEGGITLPDTPRRGKGAGPGNGQAQGRSGGSGSGPGGGR